MINNPNRCGPRRPIDLAIFKYPQPPDGVVPVHEAFCSYSREHVIRLGQDPNGPWIGFNKFFLVVPPGQDVTKIKPEQVDAYTDMRLSDGVSALTIQRELTYVRAAIRWAFKRGRIEKMPYIEFPQAVRKKRRPLREAEFQLVMKQRMSARLRRFYRLAYFTGHRSTAIEQLTWSRVDFEKLTIDFNDPTRPTPRNKRRNARFPIPHDLLPFLLQWRELAKDEFVIGAGPSTYHEAAHVVRNLAGIKDKSLVPRHCMRKFFATRLYEARVHPKKVADLICDKPETVEEFYIGFEEGSLRDAVNAR